MKFPLRKFRYWLPSLYLSIPFALMVDAEPIELQFKEPSFKNAIFKEDVNRSRIVTNASELALDAVCSDENVEFVLFQINGVDYPIFPQNGQFGQTIQLSEGRNDLKATYKEGGVQSIEREIVRLQPGSVHSVQMISKEKDPVLLTDFKKDNSTQTRTSVPTVLIAGLKGAPEGLKIQVKDQYGNLVMVHDEQEGHFSVPYTLRDGKNSLTFRYLFEDQIFKTETIQLNLEDVISLEVDSSPATDGFISFSDSTQLFTTQILEVPVVGHVDAIQDGEVLLTIEDRSLKIPVVDHDFSTIITVNPSKTTTAKVSFGIEDQSYFNYLEFNYVAPKFVMNQLRQGQLDGNAITAGTPVASIEANSFRSSSPVVQLSGDIQFLGELNASIKNTTTGSQIELGGKKGAFNANVPLVLGKNQLELVVSNGNQDVQCHQFDVMFENPIQIAEFNEKALGQSPVEVASNTLKISGSVDSIKRGILNLAIEGKEHRIPVVNGKFEYSQLHQLSEGRHLANLSFDHISFQFGKTIELNVLDVAAFDSEQEVESQAIAQVASADRVNEPGNQAATNVAGNKSTLANQEPLSGATTQNQSSEGLTSSQSTETEILPKEKITYTPPKPIRTTPPKSVRDPNNRRLKLAGSVTIGFLILENGKIDDSSFQIMESSHELLDEEAKRTLSKWRFEPAKADGVPVSKRSRITLKWN